MTEKEFPFYPSGLLPAATVEHGYRNVWIRDLWYVGICSTEPTRKRIWKGMIELLERYDWKLRIHTNQKPQHWFEYMHIRYSPEGDEIPEGWAHKQWDAIGNWLEVCLDEERLDLAAMLVDYLHCSRFYQNPAATAWEDVNIYDAYSYAACIHALQRAKKMLPASRQKIDYMVKRSISRLFGLLPYASKSRPVCMTLLGVIWPFDCAGPYREDILELTKQHLKREPFGFLRYQGDEYDGEGFTRRLGNETPWLLGDLFMAKIEPDNSEWLTRIEDARKIFGCLPEAYFPETMTANRNTPLLWAEALYNDITRR